MTTNIAQNEQIALKKYSVNGNPEKTEEKILYSDTLARISGDQPHESALHYPSSEVINLLKAAHSMIEKAENKIVNQNKRIQELESLLTTDELTGLYNRRGFFEFLNRELDRTNRNTQEGGLLVMIDLDDFKAINDTYGHLAGDACLQAVSNFLQKEIRGMDVAARLGGDEFILLLPKTNSEKAARRIQDMALRLNNLRLTYNGDTLRIGASLGFKDYGPGEDTNSVIDGADRALYKDKENRKAQSRPQKSLSSIAS